MKLALWKRHYSHNLFLTVEKELFKVAQNFLVMKMRISPVLVLCAEAQETSLKEEQQ